MDLIDEVLLSNLVVTLKMYICIKFQTAMLSDGYEMFSAWYRKKHCSTASRGSAKLYFLSTRVTYACRFLNVPKKTIRGCSPQLVPESDLS